MKLLLSSLARNRMFSKSIRRIYPKLQLLEDAFENFELMDPIHEAILVGVTDTEQPEYFVEIENNDGFFQVISGCSLKETDDEMTEQVFDILLKAVRLCPFSAPDHEGLEQLFERMRPVVLGS